MIRAILTLALLVVCPGSIHATSQIEWLTFEERAQIAKNIFAGTVSRMETVRAESVGVVTRITFEDLRFAKGNDRRSSLIMTVYGGKYPGRHNARKGEYWSFALGMPDFEKNHRYVVFGDHSLGSAADGYFPIVGWSEGAFQVRPSSGGVIHDMVGHPVIGMSRDGIVVLDASVPDRKSTVPVYSDTVVYIQPWEHKGNWGPNTRPAGRIIGVERVSQMSDTLGEVLRISRTQSGREVLRVVPRSADTGRRIHEEEFLEFIRLLREE